MQLFAKLIRIRNSVILKYRKFGTTQFLKQKHCKLLIVGGGTGGCTVAARFSKVLNKNDIIVVEPKDIHLYKSSFTFIGAGIKSMNDAVKPALKVLPQNALWIQNSVKNFSPHINRITLENNDIIEYEVMIIALGVKLDYDEIPGLEDALEKHPNVCTIYSPKYVEKTYNCMKDFVSGVALFTSPQTPTTCFAASQKICFLAEHFFRKTNKRVNADMIFASAQTSLFPVKFYEDALYEVMRKRKIDVKLSTNLIEVVPDSKKAIFACVNKPENKVRLKTC